MAPLNVGLMGYGFSTKCFHLPFILPNKELSIYAFLQRSEKPENSTQKGKHCAIDYPNAKHYRTAEEFFADPNIDLVIVCTKHDTHAEFATKALQAGKHGKSLPLASRPRCLTCLVVVEKPFTVTTAEADQVLAASRHSKGILTVFQSK